MSPNTSTGQVRYVNPDGLFKSPAFTQVVVASGPGRTVYIGGQDAVDASGAIVGKGDLQAQTAQVLRNIKTALAAVGARPEHVVKWNVYLVQGQSFQAGYEAFQREWGFPQNPPVITGIMVAGLANPDYLVEMDAIAVIPE